MAARQRALGPSATYVRAVAGGVAFLSLWAAAFLLLFSAVVQNNDQHRLFSQLRRQLADGTAPLQAPIRTGAPVALLDVPAIGLKHVVVVEGTGAAPLRSGPGHRRDTVLPGQAGVSVIFGRAVSYGGPFRDLTRLRPGDMIRTVDGVATATYRVARLRRQGDPLPQALPAGGGRLTLATLEGASVKSGFAADRAVYVDADLIGQTTPSAPVAAAAPNERLGARDTTGLAGLVFSLELLLAAVVIAVWAALRHRGPVVGLTLGPLTLLPLWWCSTSAVRLLPNVF